MLTLLLYNYGWIQLNVPLSDQQYLMTEVLSRLLQASQGGLIPMNLCWGST